MLEQTAGMQDDAIASQACNKVNMLSQAAAHDTRQTSHGIRQDA